MAARLFIGGDLTPELVSPLIRIQTLFQHMKKQYTQD